MFLEGEEDSLGARVQLQGLQLSFIEVVCLETSPKLLTAFEVGLSLRGMMERW
jgi:hypothetical protein